MSSFDPAPDASPSESTTAAHQSGADAPQQPSARVGTIVWGLIVLALAAIIIVAQLGVVTLNGTYVLIGLMIGAGAALVVGGLLSARKRDNEPTTGKS
ncbi:hypothetical protein [Pseudarthrobacter sulfonivorans]|jgi:hypothetical protein|uniref:hypothetical protein n=1 Tax=Pseudarthrobacter sulfonivorans TaxID=121292 RepID=UPI0028601718|nr:hypothetical protein [Pseudarthrobacter sulfonivorans]MDR6413551.1 hypothetical protein [Pseudarthrobacter sulfonivorans]